MNQKSNYLTPAPVTPPPEIITACERLNWVVLGQGRFAGSHSYLIRDDHFITEPYTAQAILQAAQNIGADPTMNIISPTRARTGEPTCSPSTPSTT